MNIRELIERLQKIDDKEQVVHVSVETIDHINHKQTRKILGISGVQHMEYECECGAVSFKAIMIT